MPLVDTRIPLGFSPIDLGSPMGGAIQTYSQLMNAAQQTQQFNQQKALRETLAQPDAFNEQGKIAPDVMKKVMGIDPNAGMKIAQNQQMLDQHLLQVKGMEGDVYKQKMTTIGDTFSPILESYKENVEKGMPAQQAIRNAQKSYSEAREGLSGSGLLTPDEIKNLQGQPQLQPQPTQPGQTAQVPPQTAVAQPTLPPLQEAVNQLPEIQRIKAQDTQAMFSAFDDFAKEYPQAREEQGFADFQKVSNGVNQALTDRLGRIPTYPELFKGIAGTLNWEATTPTPAKDAALKNAGSSVHTNSTTIPAAKRPKVSDASVEAYQKMFTSKTREEALKELSEVV